MAEVLAGDDPVGMYVQDKTSLKKADASIRAMARELGKKPTEVFELLRQQFESRIGSLTLKDVKAGEMKAPEGYTFPLKDLYGEVSENFFTNLLDLDTNGKPKWGSTGLVRNATPESWTDQFRSFQLNDIDKLRDSVGQPETEGEAFEISKKEQKKRGWERLSEEQMEYLTDVEGEEAGEEAAAKSRIVSHFTENGLKKRAATAKMNAGVRHLTTWPITITTKAQDMVKSDNSVVDVYKPFFSVFQKEERIDKFLPGLTTDSTVEIVEDVLGRGLDYGQERKEKDEKQIGFDSPLSLTDLPAMACINHQYELTKGPNYYGDTHFVLDPKVRQRSVFTFGTDSPERRSFFLVLDDILAKDSAKVDKICDGTYVLQDIEVHVYGNIDLRRDIIEFHLGDPNKLTAADVLKGSEKVKSMSSIIGSAQGTPEERLDMVKTMLTNEEMNELRDIWTKKKQGSEKLQEMIDTLPTGRRGKGGPCYITTACVKARGLADDCEELQTLRYFRDEYLLSLPGGMDLVMFYYENSAKIVEAIEQKPESGAIYEDLYQVIRDCVKAIHEERNQDAFATYVNMVLELRDQYTPHMAVPESLLEASRSLNQVN